MLCIEFFLKMTGLTQIDPVPDYCKQMKSENIFDLDLRLTKAEQRKSVSSLLIGYPKKKQHCYHGANSRQIKDLLMESVSVVRVITA